MRLIDKDALKAKAERIIGIDGSSEAWRILSEIDHAEEIDAVDVVRCKNCKYFDSGTDEDGKLSFKCLGWLYGGTSEDDFCSHGERKDG